MRDLDISCIKHSVLKQWVEQLPWKMQTVLIQGLRAPDTHFCLNIKNVCRWMRSIVLENADKNHTFMCLSIVTMPQDLENELNYCSFHFVSHFLYALEIISYKHPDLETRERAEDLYRGFVYEISHFNIETEAQLDVRLADVESRQVPIPVKQCPTGRADNYSWKGGGR